MENDRILMAVVTGAVVTLGAFVFWGPSGIFDDKFPFVEFLILTINSTPPSQCLFFVVHFT